MAAIAVAALALSNGGYFPTAWGWATVGFALVVVVVLVLRGSVEASWAEWAFVAGLALLAGWTALSAVWSVGAAEPLSETERLLVYVAAAAALVALGGSALGIAAGLVGAASFVALVALPGRPGDRLAGPVGYANALGLLCTLGIVLAAGIVAHARLTWQRAAAAAVVPMLAATLLLTGSRGSIGALGVGLVVFLGLDRRPLRALTVLVALAPAAALAVVSRFHPAGIAAAAVLAPILALVAVRLKPGRSRRIERAFPLGLGLAVLAATVVAVAALGGPGGIVDRFNAPLPVTGGGTEHQIFSLGGDSRGDYWRVAWREVEAHPALGGGAGSYARWWARDRPVAFPARNVHNLYLETLAELGPVGLGILVAMLAVPVVALLRGRRGALTAAAGGAYCAFLAHAALDWDWQLTAVGVAGLACGVAVLLEERGRAHRPPAAAAAAALALLIALGIVGQVGNSAVSRSAAATDRGDVAAGARLARRARTWMPWSWEPWERLGEAQLAAGDVEAARRSFRAALRRDPENWQLWLDLATASEGRARRAALARARALNPLGPEIAEVASPSTG